MDELKRTYIQRWMIKAEHDLRSARLLLRDDPPVTDTACFHAQQCVEKCLKAFLVLVDQHVERTHYLRRLVELCAQSDPQFADLMEIADALTDYAVTDRYPDNWREIPSSEAVVAVDMAARVMEFMHMKLSHISS